jgi:hypothetical protein
MTVARITDRAESDCGAILVVVAMALLVFTVLSGFVVDYGIQLVGRSQVQNAVDAAALAGATSLAYDNFADRSSTGPAYLAATSVAAENLVWEAPASITGSDVSFPVCASTIEFGESVTDVIGCVQVSGYRNSAHFNPIPALFSSLLGVASVGVSATAIAETKDANTTDCLKPIAIPDRWIELYPTPPVPWTTTSRYDLIDPMTMMSLGTPDRYIRPTQDNVGTGFQTNVEFGAHVTLMPGSIATPISDVKPWLYLPVQIPSSVWGPNNVLENTRSCAKATVGFGRVLNIATGGIPANAGLVGQGLLELFNSDPTAVWNTATHRVDNSCAESVGRCASMRSMSPRVIAVALYDPKVLQTTSRTALPTTVTVRNIVGFFIESVAGNNVTGYITRHPGFRDSTVTRVSDVSSFMRMSALVQ